jgi:DNA-3-methyladenine glycosylase
MNDPLPRSFYDRDVVQVARELLGKRLIRVIGRDLAAGRIVEVEAYLARNDPANHAHRGNTRRNASMFGPPGHAYVYAIHARFCLNVVTEPPGVPSAVLIRAIEPLKGLGLMRRRRDRDDDRNLARGPGRLCEALDIDRSLDGWDLTRGQQLWLASDPDAEPEDGDIIATTRVGVTAAKDLRLRFLVPASRFVSRGIHAARAEARGSGRGCRAGL